MRVVVAAVTIMALAAAAEAGPERGSVTAGIAVDTASFLNLGLTLDGSYRIRWLALRAIVTRGVSLAQGGGDGPLRRYVAGAELRPCDGPRGCPYLGFDAGYETSDVYSQEFTDYQSHGAIATVRAGVYLTHGRLAARSGFVFFEYDEHSQLGTGWRGGLGIELSVGLRF